METAQQSARNTDSIDLIDHSNLDQCPPTDRPAVHLVDEVEELADVVGDGGDVRVGPLQVLLVDLAHALHALVHL